MAANLFPKHLFSQRDLHLALEKCAEVSGVTEFIVAGSQAIQASLADTDNDDDKLSRSTDIDLYPAVTLDAERLEHLRSAVGPGSPFHSQHLWEVEVISDWVVDGALIGWRDRCIKVETPNQVIGWCLAPLDIAHAKAGAGRAKDIVYLAALFESGLVAADHLIQRVREAAAPEADDIIHSIHRALRLTERPQLTIDQRVSDELASLGQDHQGWLVGELSQSRFDRLIPLVREAYGKLSLRELLHQENSPLLSQPELEEFGQHGLLDAPIDYIADRWISEVFRAHYQQQPVESFVQHCVQRTRNPA